MGKVCASPRCSCSCMPSKLVGKFSTVGQDSLVSGTSLFCRETDWSRNPEFTWSGHFPDRIFEFMGGDIAPSAPSHCKLQGTTSDIWKKNCFSHFQVLGCTCASILTRRSGVCAFPVTQPMTRQYSCEPESVKVWVVPLM